MIRDILAQSSVWGSAVTLLCWLLFTRLQKKTGIAAANPLLLSAIAIGALLLSCGIPAEQYESTASPLTWLLLPATVCLAVPLHEQWALFRRNWLPILSGIACGSLASLLLIAAIAKAFGLESAYAVSLLPKSVTTAIGADISRELGGIPSLTIGVIVLTGIAGNMLAPALCRLLRLRSPIARGVAIGTCSHAIGTSRALEMGQAEGSMSGVSLAIAGILTAVLCPFVARLF